MPLRELRFPGHAACGRPPASSPPRSAEGPAFPPGRLFTGSAEWRAALPAAGSDPLTIVVCPHVLQRGNKESATTQLCFR